ncbi:hypothetical protein EAO77_07900 [Streptomyces sp. t39]|nr:hypothetical protein EAO77_07900 [Streptomyces sp. t39]
MMLRAVMDTAKTNETIRTGRAQELWASILGHLKPEAAYFSPHDGCRACVIVFDMQDSTTLPVLVEPFFQEFGARVEIAPCMDRDDLMKGLAQVAGGH